MNLKYILLALCLSLCSLNIIAQKQEQSSPMPDRWRGLIIDQSTPDDAIKTLGQPKKDKPSSTRTYPLNKRLTLDHNSKGIRKLNYERLEGIKEASLYFKDNKLILIELQLEKKVEASAIPRIYGIRFTPKISGMEMAFNPRAYETDKGNIYPRNYPVVYYLIGLSDQTYVSAMVENGGMGNILLGSSRGKISEDDDAGFPGKVSRIQIISRTLENREGEDVLK
jgi:hypothetical protein